MHAKRLASCPGVLNKHVGRDVLHLPHDIQFGKAVEARGRIGHHINLVAMGLIRFADRMKPVIDEPATLSINGGGYAATAIMADHHDVLHPQHIHGKLQYGKIISVLRRGEIGDISMHEQLARVEADNLVGGDSAVRAADPKVSGRLLAFQPLKKIRIGRYLSLGPFPIV